MYANHSPEVSSRLTFLSQTIGDYPAGIDPDFDIELDDLDREFAELRMQFND